MPSAKTHLVSSLLFSEYNKLCLKCLDVDDVSRLCHLKTMLTFLTGVHEKAVRGNCDVLVFKNNILKRKSIESLEVLWFLDYLNIFPFIEYLQANDSTLLMKEIITLYIKSYNDEESLKKVAVTNLLYRVLRNLKISGRPILVVIIEILSPFLQLESVEKMNDILNSVMSQLDDDAKKYFCASILETVITGKASSDVLQILSFSDCKKDLELILLSLFSAMSSLECLNIFEKTILSNCFNVNIVKFLIHGYCNYFTDGVSSIKKLISAIVDKSLLDFNELLLGYGFMLARECCHLESFGNYSAWFISSFSSESSRPLATEERARFFMQFLSSIVHIDFPRYLKVHINKVPYVPSNCQYMLSEYVSLAKTRLTDMNETFDLGIFENNDESKSSSEFDVECAVAHFRKTGEISKSILEASLFRKTYYEKKFLVKLLSIKEEPFSMRHKLIEKLNIAGKIPISLYTVYNNKRH